MRLTVLSGSERLLDFRAQRAASGIGTPSFASSTTIGVFPRDAA
jgi:hypothetical protein